MLLEHSVQGYVDLAFPGKHLEVIGLSYAKLLVDDPEYLESSISFQTDPAKLEIQLGQEGVPIPFAWFVSYPRISPWRENSYARFDKERRLVVSLNPDLPLDSRAVFFVYSGGRILRKDATAWIINHPSSLH
jgi:hypothetical protein